MSLLKSNLDTDKISDIVKNGHVAVVSGSDFITINQMDDEYLSGVEEAAKAIGIPVHVVEAGASPRTASALGVDAVPAMVQVVDGKVSSRYIGVASAPQLKMFMRTGVPPT